MSITRIIALSCALMFGSAVGAVAFTPAAHAVEPCCNKTGKVITLSNNGAQRRGPTGAGFNPCCQLRTNVGGGTTGRK